MGECEICGSLLANAHKGSKCNHCAQKTRELDIKMRRHVQRLTMRRYAIMVPADITKKVKIMDADAYSITEILGGTPTYIYPLPDAISSDSILYSCYATKKGAPNERAALVVENMGNLFMPQHMRGNCVFLGPQASSLLRHELEELLK